MARPAARSCAIRQCFYLYRYDDAEISSSLRCRRDPLFCRRTFLARAKGQTGAGRIESETEQGDANSAEATPGNKDAKDRDKDKGKDEEKDPPPSVTEHTLTVGGKTIHYRATAGYMVMRDWSEKKKAEEGDGERGRHPRRIHPSERRRQTERQRRQRQG